jgi:hypothetical protein
MSDTAIDIRRRALEEAAVEVCGYCRGVSGHNPVPVEFSGAYVHLFTHGNGSNPCASGRIWAMVAEAKRDREMCRLILSEGSGK